jgi:hypothetical protein
MAENPEKAKKEVDKIATLAEDKKTREEASTIAKKLEAVVKEEGEQGQPTTTTLSSHEKQQVINRALDETKDNIRKATDEAKREIPRYTQTVNDYQEQTIQAAREIADNYIETQKEVINSLQSAWIPQLENTYGVYLTAVSPRRLTEVYARMVSSFADNTIAVSRLANNVVFANMEAFRTSIQHAKDNVKELSRIGVNAAKTFEQTSRDTTRGFVVETTEERQRR